MIDRLELAESIVRGWTRLYTWGVPAEAAERRRDEVESDLWESTHDAIVEAEPSPALVILARLLAGIPDDLSWRVEHATFEDNRLIGRALIAVGGGVLLAMLWTAPHAGRLTDRCGAAMAAPRKPRVEQVAACVGVFFTASRDRPESVLSAIGANCRRSATALAVPVVLPRESLGCY